MNREDAYIVLALFALVLVCLMMFLYYFTRWYITVDPNSPIARLIRLIQEKLRKL